MPISENKKASNARYMLHCGVHGRAGLFAGQAVEQEPGAVGKGGDAAEGRVYLGVIHRRFSSAYSQIVFPALIFGARKSSQYAHIGPGPKFKINAILRRPLAV